MAKTKKSEKKSSKSKAIVLKGRHERSTKGTHVYLVKDDGSELPTAEETASKDERDKERQAELDKGDGQGRQAPKSRARRRR